MLALWSMPLSKLLSHPLHEVRSIGQEVKTESQKIVPTLVKYANENSYIKDSSYYYSILETSQKNHL